MNKFFTMQVSSFFIYISVLIFTMNCSSDDVTNSVNSNSSEDNSVNDAGTANDIEGVLTGHTSPSEAKTELDAMAITIDPNAKMEYYEFEGIYLAYTASNMIYAHGDRNGSFPDFGQQEVPNEMGGIWFQPFKMMDGFWAKIDTETWLKKADSFVLLPYGSKYIYNLSDVGLKITRFQYCPDDIGGLIVEYQIENTTTTLKEIDFSFLGKIDILPWIPFEESEVLADGVDSASWNSTSKTIIGLDATSNFHVIYGYSFKVSDAPEINSSIVGPETTKGKNSISALLPFKIKINASKSSTIRFFIASGKDKEVAQSNYNSLKANYATMFESKITKFSNLLNKAKISIPDQDLQKAYDWAKIHTEWMNQKVEGVGEGMMAVLPSFPWWMPLDSVYGLRGVLAQGGATISKNTLKLYTDATAKKEQNGRIAQSVYTDGNIDMGDPYEVALYLVGVQDYLDWTGDTQFIADMFETVKKIITWLESKDSDSDLVADGQVAIEHYAISMEPITTAVYTYAAYSTASEMAILLEDTTLAATYQTKADTLKSHINNNYWDASKGRYADIYGPGSKWLEYFNEETTGEFSSTNSGNDKTRIQIVIEDIEGGTYHVTDQALADLKSLNTALNSMSTTELATETGWTQLNTALNITPLEFGLASSDIAATSFINSRVFDDNCYGWEAQGTLAVSECRYGNLDQCLDYINVVSAKWKEANYILAEQFDLYPIVYPLVYYIFGIQPKADNKTITLKPRMPTAWADKTISITSLPVGNTEITMTRSVSGSIVTYNVTITDNSWTLTLNLPASASTTYTINGALATPTDNGNTEFTFSLTGSTSYEITITP